MASQVFDLRKSTGMSRGQSNEHLRNFSLRAYEEKVAHNFDPTREHLNFEVLPGFVIAPVNKEDSIDNRIRRNLISRSIKDPNAELAEKDKNRRNTVLAIIFSGSRDRMRELAFGDQEIDEGDIDKPADNRMVKRMPEIEEWAKDMYDFACKKFGAKNVVAFVCHLDEKNPHVHCTILPVGKVRGKDAISVNSVVGIGKYAFRDFMNKCHDELSEINEKWALNRGKNVQVTGARHRTTEEYWKWLSEKCTELENEKKGLEHEVNFLKMERDKAQKAVKGLSTMVNNLNAQIETLQDEIQELEGDRYWAETGVDDKKQELENKKKELLRLQASLTDKQGKLKEAVDKLDTLNAKYSDTQKQISESEKVLAQLTPEAKGKSFTFAKAIAWNEAVKEIKETRQRLDCEKQDMGFSERCGFEKCEDVIFGEDSIISDMEDSGEDIINLASSLFVGYLNDATTFVHGSSVGGGGSRGGWGRKKDEDDMEFMTRCIQMARSMMKPAKRKSRMRR